MAFWYHVPFHTSPSASPALPPPPISEEIRNRPYDFSRPEMYTENLAGTVDAYDRHVFLCYQNHLLWPPIIENTDSHPRIKRLVRAMRARENEFPLKTKFTVCEAREQDRYWEGDVLVFHCDMFRYKFVSGSNVDKFVDKVLVRGGSWVRDRLIASHIFVCAHASRDARCAVCGPLLIEKLNEEIELRGLKDQISVLACSHVGGHKYAGNLIIYSDGPDGNLMGHWYGYVTPNDVPALLDQHIARGEIIQNLWRGQMRPPVDEWFEQDEGTEETTEQDEVTEETTEQDEGIEETTEAHKKQGSKISWNWPVLQERQILAAAGILGALAAVAVAYRFYRWSG